MGREVRRVPADWEHPKKNGRYEPLYDGSYTKRARQWLDDARAWDDGTHADLVRDPELKARMPFFWEWDGGPPDPEDYMPDWPEERRTHLQMYENTSEGTPISPVMSTPEELARWLADNRASSFGDMTATYEQWLSTIKRGWAPSAIATVGGPMVSGVEGLSSLPESDPR